MPQSDDIARAMSNELNHREPGAVQLFIDMDGVLADFDRHHETHFGSRPCKNSDNVDWKAVRKIADFYLGIPPMADLDALWARIASCFRASTDRPCCSFF
jgi:hypothetical protein